MTDREDWRSVARAACEANARYCPREGRCRLSKVWVCSRAAVGRTQRRLQIENYRVCTLDECQHCDTRGEGRGDAADDVQSVEAEEEKVSIGAFEATAREARPAQAGTDGQA